VIKKKVFSNEKKVKVLREVGQSKKRSGKYVERMVHQSQCFIFGGGNLAPEGFAVTKARKLQTKCLPKLAFWLVMF
jgi:hypothetical protein